MVELVALAAHVATDPKRVQRQSDMLEIFKDRVVVVTGHTGFKGSWLVTWLRSLGARVVGIALDPPSHPAHFTVAQLSKGIEDHRQDLRDQGAIARIILDSQPDLVIHLAAQALVRRSYSDPVRTYQTNILGTLNLLEALRLLDRPCVAVIITSDKCYENVGWVWGYRENDQLGGGDPYSASKAAAEILIRSHVKSFFPSATSKVRIGVARAGNVIGGGDWAEDRIVPDCVRAWSRDETAVLRNPRATRPWQHVLEPLAGYLTLAAALYIRADLHGEPFNFGPPGHHEHTVSDLVQQMGRYWKQVRWALDAAKLDGPREPSLLKLNCDKALHELKWRPVLTFDETVQLTAEWYRSYYEDPQSVAAVTLRQIEQYVELAAQRKIPWASSV